MHSLSVGLRISCEPYKMAKPIEMLFGLTLVGPRNHALDGVQIAECKGAIFGEKTGGPL